MPPPPPPKLLEQVRRRLRLLRMSLRTEEAYLGWVQRFVLFHDKRHPASLGETEVVAFLQYLALERQVAASTHNQALNALVFLYTQDPASLQEASSRTQEQEGHLFWLFSN